MKVIFTPVAARLSMRRNTVLAFSLAAGLALPLGFSTTALAITDAQRAILSDAAANVDLDMQAAIATVLNQELAAQERPLEEVIDDLAEALLALGVNNEVKAEYAVALVAAASDWSDEAANEAAEAVLVRAQTSPTLVSAIVAQAGDLALTGMPGSSGTTVLGVLAATSSTSTAIDLATAGAVFSKSAEIGRQKAAGDLGGPGTPFSRYGTGNGPLGGGLTFASTPNPGRSGGGEQAGAGRSTSPN